MRASQMFVVFFGILAIAGTVVPQQSDAAFIEKYKTQQPSIEKAKKALLREDYAKCDRELGRCFEMLADHHEAHYLKAQVLYKQGDFAGALDHIQTAKAGYARLQAAIQRIQAEDLKKQISKREDIADRLPELADAMDKANCSKPIWQGRILDAQNQLNEANKEVASELVGRKIAAPAEYDYFQGNCLFKLNRLDEAETWYKSAVATDPLNANAYNNLVNLLYAEKRFNEARNFLDRAEANKVHIIPGLRAAVLEATRK